jgi:hypothetical protein
MGSFLSKLFFFLIGSYIFFNFLQFKGGKNIPQMNTVKRISQALSPSQSDSTLEGNFIEKTLSRVFLNLLQSQEGVKFAQHFNISSTQEEAYLSYLNQEPIIHHTQIKEGEGKPASCNDTLIINYEKFNKDKILIKEEKNVSFTLNKHLPHNLQTILMKKRIKEEFEAQVYEASSNNFEIYKVFIKTINFNRHQALQLRQLDIKEGKGKKLFCGNTISVKFTLEISPNLPPLISTIRTEIGDNNIPLEIIHSFLGQRIGTKITFATNKKVIDLISTNNKKIFNINSIDDNNYLILTVELID